MLSTHPALASLFVIAFALIVFRFVARDYARSGKLGIPTAALQFLLFFLHGLAYYSFFDNRHGSPSASRVILLVAIVLIAVGLAALFAAMAQLSMGDTVGRSVKGLKKSGFYRFSRNPQLIAYLLFLTGYALLTPQWLGLGWLALYALIAHMMVLTEEAHLRRVCREDFDDYCRRTPRYLGWYRKIPTS